MQIKSTFIDIFLKQPSLAMVSTVILSAILFTLWIAIMFFNALNYDPDIEEFKPSLKKIKTIDPTNISNRNFFGIPDNSPKIDIEQLPETKLELILAGVFESNSESSGSAIIIDNNQESKFYSVGDELPGNVILSSVNSNSVVLDRNGIFETLYFEDVDNKSVSSRPISTFLQKSPEKAKEDLRKRIEDLKKKKRTTKNNQFNQN